MLMQTLTNSFFCSICRNRELNNFLGREDGGVYICQGCEVERSQKLYSRKLRKVMKLEQTKTELEVKNA